MIERHNKKFSLYSLPSDEIMLAFAGAENEHYYEEFQSGYLLPSELEYRTMDDTELIVITACFSGDGDFDVHNGIMGFSSMLRANGVKSGVYSLWECGDFSAYVFMEKFYELLSIYTVGIAINETKRYMSKITVYELKNWLIRKRKKYPQNLAIENKIKILDGRQNQQAKYFKYHDWSCFYLILY
jgi:CHAT domain-containing protein